MESKVYSERDSIQSFLKGYKEEEPPQTLKSSSGDFQLASVRPLIGEKLNSDGYTKLFDIGCGNAVLLNGLSEMNIFESHPEFKYIGIDFEDNLREAHGTALELQLYHGLEFYPVSYDWGKYTQNSKNIYFFRNVFHELTISQTAEYIEFLSSCKPDDCIIIQDMTTLPVAERSRAGWMAHLLHETFTELSFHANVYPDKSKSGIEVFVLTAQNRNTDPLDLEFIKATLIKKRTQQLSLLKQAYSDNLSTYSEIGRARLLHDIYAISKQLGIPLDEPNQVAPELVRLALTVIKSNTVLNEIKREASIDSIDYFQNRGRPLQGIDDFLLSESSQVLMVTGTSLIGKKALINQALVKFDHNRVPVYITLSEQISALSIFEQIIEQLGATRYLDVDILAASTINFEAILGLLQDNDLFENIVSNTVLIFSEIEAICDESKEIENKDFTTILENWTLFSDVKIIIDCRFTVPNINTITDKVEQLGLMRFYSHDNSTFGKHQYPVQMLQQLVPINYRNPQFASTGGFPESLLDIIDNHPYIAYLSALKIKQCNDVSCLSDIAFIGNIQNKVLKDLVADFNLGDDELSLLRQLLTLNDNYDMEELYSLSDSPATIEHLIEKGILIPRESGQLFGVLPVFVTSKFKSEVYDSNAESITTMNVHLTKVYQSLYNKSSSPRHFRKYMYFSLLSGQGEVSGYTIEQSSDIAEALFREHDYAKATMFYTEISKYRTLTTHQQMRKASCQIRTGDVPGGLDLYTHLFKNHPNWIQLRHSCVDALFYLDIELYAKRAQEILNSIATASRTDYWFYQMAKANSYLNQRDEAFENYNLSMTMCNDSERAVDRAIEAISFANTTYSQDKAQEYIGFLEHKPYRDQLKALIEIGSHYEKMKDPSTALPYLEEAYALKPGDPYVILPLVKTYCSIGKHDKAKQVIEAGEKNSYIVQSDVFNYAQVCYYKSLKDFPAGEEFLIKINSDKVGIPFMTQWTEFYFEWLQADPKNTKAKRRVNKYAEEIESSNNIPSKITLVNVYRQLGEDEKATELSVLIGTD